MARESLEISANTSLNKTSENVGGSFVLGLIPPHLHTGKHPSQETKSSLTSPIKPPHSQTFKATQTVVKQPSFPKKNIKKSIQNPKKKCPDPTSLQKETRGSQLSAMIFKSKVKALKPQSEASAKNGHENGTKNTGRVGYFMFEKRWGYIKKREGCFFLVEDDFLEGMRWRCFKVGDQIFDKA